MVKSAYSLISQAHKSTGIPWHVIERDYLLSWILAGISQVPALSDTLVFKGGTALRKCYFDDYRFSEDLDFTGLPTTPRGDNMENSIREACEIVQQRLLKEPVNIVCKRYKERRPHPGNQEAFKIRARLPWHNYPLTGIMVEITMDEKILRPQQRRKIIHHYDEPLEAEINTYSLEEVVAEKLRAVLQNVDRFKSSRWVRPRARDYYDLWHILSARRDDMDFTDFSSFLRNKCSAKNIMFTGAEDFFDDGLLALVGRDWERSLGDIVPDPPALKMVLSDLRIQIAGLFS